MCYPKVLKVSCFRPFLALALIRSKTVAYIGQWAGIRTLGFRAYDVGLHVEYSYHRLPRERLTLTSISGVEKGECKERSPPSSVIVLRVRHLIAIRLYVKRLLQA